MDRQWVEYSPGATNSKKRVKIPINSINLKQHKGLMFSSPSTGHLNSLALIKDQLHYHTSSVASSTSEGVTTPAGQVDLLENCFSRQGSLEFNPLSHHQYQDLFSTITIDPNYFNPTLNFDKNSITSSKGLMESVMEGGIGSSYQTDDAVINDIESNLLFDPRYSMMNYTPSPAEFHPALSSSAYSSTYSESNYSAYTPRSDSIYSQDGSSTFGYEHHLQSPPLTFAISALQLQSQNQLQQYQQQHQYQHQHQHQYQYHYQHQEGDRGIIEPPHLLLRRHSEPIIRPPPTPPSALISPKRSWITQNSISSIGEETVWIPPAVVARPKVIGFVNSTTEDRGVLAGSSRLARKRSEADIARILKEQQVEKEERNSSDITTIESG
jgi:hypothetical protein